MGAERQPHRVRRALGNRDRRDNRRVNAGIRLDRFIGTNGRFNSGATGTLRLDNSRQFSGTIGGLATNGSNALDLSDISFISGTTRATFAGTASGGTLTVSEATNVANLVLTGNYVGQSWVVSSDGHGGTKVIDPDPSDATVDSAATAISSGPASATLASLFPWSRNAVAPGDLLQAYPWLNPTSGSDTRAGLPSFNTATSPASFVPVFVERVSAWPAPVPSGT